MSFCASGTPEPEKITAGDSPSWVRPCPDYPPSAGWSMSYGAAGYGVTAPATLAFNATAGADGASFNVALTTGMTGGWAPGPYVWSAFVTNNGRRVTVARGTFTVLPDPAASAVALQHAQRALALIEAALEGRIPRGLEDTTIDGQQLTRMPIQDLHAMRDKYRGEVKNLERAALAAAGVEPKTTIYLRFRDPRGFGYGSPRR